MVYEVSDSKAIMGAAFIHYVVYCVFYVIDTIKMQDADDPNQENQDPNVRKAKERAEKKKKEQQKNPPITSGNPAAPADKPGVEMKDINLQDREEGKAGVGPGPRTAKSRRDDDDDSDEEETFDGYDDDGKPFFTKVVNRFPKTSCFYFMILALAAARAATPFGIVLAYFSLIGRIMQIVGAFVEKPILGFIGYGITAGLMFILFFVIMIHEKD
ncbi:unnamed protein product [Moneuplotes crassus]|uniref:Transmembrane protein n=2 Tax=Euplotes crassus TaxID=5936 RepID=A0AAD2D5W1_EUPCR|nr:unnamed protein product [Moneuplotes crassus]